MESVGHVAKSKMHCYCSNMGADANGKCGHVAKSKMQYADVD